MTPDRSVTPGMPAAPATRVVAGVLRNPRGQVLIAQRPPGKHLAGYWEFPGGKVAPGETGPGALARELHEELGIVLQRCHPLMQLRHDYGDRVIELEVFVVDDYAGEPLGRELQALKWVAAAELGCVSLLPADQPIVDTLIETLNSKR
jgi:8-oxo-dGTP diphosphatase